MDAGVNGLPQTLQARVTKPAAWADLPAQLREQNRRCGRVEGKGRPQYAQHASTVSCALCAPMHSLEQ